MVDQKVAILVALCVFIIMFVWTPGMLVRRERYIVNADQVNKSGTPFTLKDGDDFVMFESSTGRFTKSKNSNLAAYFRVITNTEVSPGFKPIQMVSVNSDTPPDQGKQYIRHRSGFIYVNDYEPGNVDFGWKFVSAGGDSVVILNNYIDKDKNNTGLQFKDGYLINASDKDKKLVRFQVDMVGPQPGEPIKIEKKPPIDAIPMPDGKPPMACGEERQMIDSLKNKIKELNQKLEDRPNKKRTTSNYVQPNMDDQTMPISGDDFEPHTPCDSSAWWSSGCNMYNDLDYETTAEPMLRPREQAPIDGFPLEYQPMSTEGSRRVLGPDGPKETLPMMNAWDNTNELSTEMGGSVSLDQTQLDQIRGNAAADRLSWNNLNQMQPMSQESVA